MNYFRIILVILLGAVVMPYMAYNYSQGNLFFPIVLFLIASMWFVRRYGLKYGVCLTMLLFVSFHMADQFVTLKGNAFVWSGRHHWEGFVVFLSLQAAGSFIGIPWGYKLHKRRLKKRLKQTKHNAVSQIVESQQNNQQRLQ